LAVCIIIAVSSIIAVCVFCYIKKRLIEIIEYGCSLPLYHASTDRHTTEEVVVVENDNGDHSNMVTPRRATDTPPTADMELPSIHSVS
jgi:hypothetical protein